MLCQPGSGSYLDISTQHHIGTNPDPSAECGALADAGGGVNAGCKLGFWKQGADNTDNCLVGVLNHNPGAGATRPGSELFRYQDSAGVGSAEVRSVSARDSKGESVRAGPAQRPDGFDANIPVAKQAATDQFGDRLRGKAATRHAPSCPL